MTMTFKEWQATSYIADFSDADDYIREHFENDDQMPDRVRIYADGAWIAISDHVYPMPVYFTVADRDSIETGDLGEAERFLWDNHSKFEAGA